MSASFATLSDSEKDAWVIQHIPHRICAALTWLEMAGMWALPKVPEIPKTGNFHVWCMGRSIDEGHLAAMRWLIEFIGITWNEEKKMPVPPRPHSNGKSVSIAQAGGAMFPLSNAEDAKFLARTWQACTQASLHPTTDTNHMPLPPDTLAKALGMVIDHLQIALYGPRDRDLRQIVLDQERLAIERGKAMPYEGARSNVVVQLTSS